MRYITFEPSDAYPIAILIKSTAFNQGEIERYYVDTLVDAGIPKKDLVAMTLQYTPDNKAPVKLIKEYLEDLLPALDSVGTRVLYCADAAYFKVLTKSRKAEPFLGYVLDCAIKGYEHMKVCLGINHKALVHDPAKQPKLELSVDALCRYLKGDTTQLGQGIIHSAHYPTSAEQIRLELQELHQHAALATDIEAFSLRFNEAGVGTISFSWDQHNGMAFPCDYRALAEPVDGLHGEFIPNPEVRTLIRQFLETYEGKLIWHGSTYDLKVLIYTLWMKGPLDQVGLLTGLDTMTRLFDDTKIIAYLATNTTAGNNLGLKDLAHGFAGNWAMGDDIKDIRKIPLHSLLEYNLIDALSTFYVHNTHYPVMCADGQLEIYRKLMLPSLKTIIQMELTGMPLNPQRVQEVKQELNRIRDHHSQTISGLSCVQDLETRLQREAMEAANAKLKTKQHPLSKFADLRYNPNSGPQTQKLLYDTLGLPVLDTTDTGQPSVDGATLAKLEHHTTDADALALLGALRGFADADKILGTFIAAFERAVDKDDGVVWLHGNFNLGGTKSGRLSSSGPNLQNLPSGSTFGKLIKSCFQAPEGYIFCGADFNSLEDYVSALTTRDPNKLKVYEQGYDGHGLRAFNYWPEKFPYEEITPELSHAMKKDKVLEPIRSDSKAPTFLLTYGGTYHGLMNNCGFPEPEAKRIEDNYHEMYKVSDAWVQDKLDQAAKDGYVTVAFGLRLRTPLLARSLRNSSAAPYQAKAEGRTAGNALGQSYGLLTNRAANAFMEKVWNSPYRYDIRPVAMIHDAIYLVIKDDLAAVEWVNEHLIAEMEWQELPELKHDTVKLGAELDLFWPTWANAITLPNGATQDDIRALCQGAVDDQEAA